MTWKATPVPPPLSADEKISEYAHRLERIGYDEMRIRKEVARYFPRSRLNISHIFNELSDARIRYITMIHQISPKKPHKGLVKKLAASIGISEDEAERAVRRFEEVGELPFIPWTTQ